MKPIIYIAFAFALFFNTCKRDGLFFKCKPENTIKIPPHAMDFFYFKTGSWWVYECEQTGYRDSLYAINNFFVVENYKGAKKECNCAWGKCFQNGGVQFYSRQRDSLNLGNNGEKIGYLFNHYHIDDTNKYPNYGSTEIKEGYELQTNLPGYRMDYRENDYINPSGNGATLRELDSLVVKNQVFRNILEYSYQGGTGYPDWFQIAWYGKNMHLVKFIKTDGTVWNLVKWNIVQ